MEDYNITKGATVHLVLKLGGGCFVGQSLIQTSIEGGEERIDKLKIGSIVFSMNAKEELEEDEVTNVHSTLVEEVLTIHLAGGSAIQCTPNHLFLTSKGEWRRYELREGCNDRLKIGDLLKTTKGK